MEKNTDKKSDKTAVWLEIVKKIDECRKRHMTWKQIAEATGMTTASAQSNWYRRKHLLEGNPEGVAEEIQKDQKLEETDTQEISEVEPVQEKGKMMEQVTEAEAKTDIDIQDDEPDDAWIMTADTKKETGTETGNVRPDQYMVHLLKDVIRYRTHYLVDTENFGAPIVEQLVTGLKDTEMIHLFYTDHSAALPYRITEKLLQKPDQIRLESCIAGTANAMDFQLISALGCLLSACDPEKNDFKIISDDHGYDATVSFWTKRGMPVARVRSCTVILPKTQAKTKTKRKTDAISTIFQERDTKEQERWVQVMSCYYGTFCKKHHVTAVTPAVNSRILLLHPDFRAEDFAKDAAGFLTKVPKDEILKARMDVFAKFR